jgi:tRNA1Val (adenine37-N6)-methyltransferase
MSSLSAERPEAFRFKKFVIEHDRCAMKVGTDSIILGSWTKPVDAKYILDIGSGSGILTLMMAQKALPTAMITGVELDARAHEQSEQNVRRAGFGQAIKMLNADVKTIYPSKKYDLIISNPPYYKDEIAADLRRNPISSSRNQARSQACLSHEELCATASRMLAQDGQFVCILPTKEIEAFIVKAKSEGLVLEDRVEIHSYISAQSIRTLVRFVFASKVLNVSRLVIYDSKGQYTKEYKSLCKDFYLNF